MISFLTAILFFAALLIRGTLNIYRINTNALHIPESKVPSYISSIILSFCGNLLAILGLAWLAGCWWIGHAENPVEIPLFTGALVFAGMIGVIGIGLEYDRKETTRKP